MLRFLAIILIIILCFVAVGLFIAGGKKAIAKDKIEEKRNNDSDDDT